MAFPFQSFFVRNDRKKPQQAGQPAGPGGPSSQPPMPGGGIGPNTASVGMAGHGGHGGHSGGGAGGNLQQQQQSTADYYADPLSLPGIIVPGAAQANANATAGTYSSAPHFTIPSTMAGNSPHLTYHAGGNKDAAVVHQQQQAVSPYLGYQQQPAPQYPAAHAQYQQHPSQASYPSATTPQPYPTTPTFSAAADPTTPTTPGLSSQLNQGLHLSTSAPNTPGLHPNDLQSARSAASDAWSVRSRRSSIATSVAPVDEEVTDVHIDEIIQAANEIAAIAATCKPNTHDATAAPTTPPPASQANPVTVADLLTTPTGSRQFMLLWRRTLDLCAAVVRIRDNVSLQGTLDDLEGDDMEEIRRRRYLGSLTGGGVGPGNRVRSKSRGSVKSTKSDGTSVVAGTATKGKPAKEGQRCASCGTSSTPEWRRGPLGPGTLCNACGLHYSKMKRQRKKKEAEAQQQQQQQEQQQQQQQQDPEADSTLADVMRIVNGDPGPTPGGEDNMQGVQQSYDPPQTSPPPPPQPQQQPAYPAASTDALGFPSAVAPGLGQSTQQQAPYQPPAPPQQQVQYHYSGGDAAGGYPQAQVYVIQQQPATAHPAPPQGYAPPYPIASYAPAQVQYAVVQHNPLQQQQQQQAAQPQYVYPSAVPNPLPPPHANAQGGGQGRQ